MARHKDLHAIIDNGCCRAITSRFAMPSRPRKNDLVSTLEMSDDLRKSLNPTDAGRIIVFDDQDRIVGASEVLDMRQVGGMYTQHLMKLRSEQ